MTEKRNEEKELILKIYNTDKKKRHGSALPNSCIKVLASTMTVLEGTIWVEGLGREGGVLRKRVSQPL